MLARKFTIAAGTLAAAAAAGYFYAREVETRRLNIKEYAVSSKRIPSAFDGMKIVQFSDLHLGYHFSIKKMRKLVTVMMNEQPDLILFTGDFADRPIRLKWKSEIQELLGRLSAEFGTYWIYGNHDYRDESEAIVNKYLSGAGFTGIHNKSEILEKDGQQIAIAGIDDVIRGRPNLHAALEKLDEDIFTILLAHEPDLADNVKHLPVDLQLSGHSHGGQVRIPYYGHVITPPYAKKYVEDQFRLGDRPLHLLVSRGVGTTRMPIRFACAPEFSVITLQHGEENIEAKYRI